MAPTILEFVLERYLGKPRSHGSGPGVSYWPCPICNDPSFHTLPDKPPFKHRAKCWSDSCGFRGDVWDMLREFEPDATYGEHRDLYWEMMDQLERTLALARGRGVTKRRTKAKRKTK